MSNQQPSPPPNVPGTVSLLLGLSGVLLHRTQGLALVLGVLAVVAGAMGLSFGTRHDTGIAAAISGALLGVVSVVFGAFAIGGLGSF